MNERIGEIAVEEDVDRSRVNFGADDSAGASSEDGRAGVEVDDWRPIAVCGEDGAQPTPLWLEWGERGKRDECK